MPTKQDFSILSFALISVHKLVFTYPSKRWVKFQVLFFSFFRKLLNKRNGEWKSTGSPNSKKVSVETVLELELYRPFTLLTIYIWEMPHVKLAFFFRFVFDVIAKNTVNASKQLKRTSSKTETTNITFIKQKLLYVWLWVHFEIRKSLFGCRCPTQTKSQ